jgi:DNA-binding NarL/FixJ family response regulator
VLATQPDLQVVGEAASGRGALDLCRALRPDLVLMDVNMPEMDGLEATRMIKAELPATSILIITAHADPDYLLRAVEVGAAGYVLKDAPKGRLIDAVRGTLSGESPLDQKLAMQLIRRFADKKAEGGTTPDLMRRQMALVEPLTVREVEVLRLVARGYNNPEIASDLVISRATVKTHVQHIIRKLNVSDRTQAAIRAVELGIVQAGFERPPAR